MELSIRAWPDSGVEKWVYSANGLRFHTNQLSKLSVAVSPRQVIDRKRDAEFVNDNEWPMARFLAAKSEPGPTGSVPSFIAVRGGWRWKPVARQCATASWTV